MTYEKLMTTELFEKLLSNGEGYLVDYKREQYLFDKTDFDSKGIIDKKVIDDKRGELLKDILAFANTERDFDAFILIGVDDIGNGKRKRYHITKHPDSASFQQFVNNKTNIPVKFEYKPFIYKRKSIGIFHIYKEQDDLICVTNDFGKVRQNIFYYRDGSFTKELSLEQIKKRLGKKDEVKKLNSIQPIFDCGIGGLINFEKKEYSLLIVQLWNETEPIKRVKIEWLDELSHHPNYSKNVLLPKEQIRIELKEETFKALPSFFKFRIYYIDKEGNNCNKLFHFHIENVKTRRLEEIKTRINP